MTVDDYSEEVFETLDPVAHLIEEASENVVSATQENDVTSMHNSSINEIESNEDILKELSIIYARKN